MACKKNSVALEITEIPCRCWLSLRKMVKGLIKLFRPIDSLLISPVMLPRTSAVPEPKPLATSTVLFRAVLPTSVAFFPKLDSVAFADSAVLFRAFDALVPSPDTV